MKACAEIGDAKSLPRDGWRGGVDLVAVMTFPLQGAGSGGGRRLRFPVILLDGDGVTLLLPGTAARIRLTRHRWTSFVCRRGSR